MFGNMVDRGRSRTLRSGHQTGLTAGQVQDKHGTSTGCPVLVQAQDKCRTSTGQLQDNYRTPTLADRAPANMQHDHTECRFCLILCRKMTLIEDKNVEFLFCNFGIACTCCVGVVWCGWSRVNHRTSTGQVHWQEKTSISAGQLYKTTTGQVVQGNYRTTIGQLQDTVLQSSLPSGHASGHCPAPLCRPCRSICGHFRSLLPM